MRCRNDSLWCTSGRDPLIRFRHCDRLLGEHFDDGRMFVLHRGRNVTFGSFNRVRYEHRKAVTTVEKRAVDQGR